MIKASKTCANETFVIDGMVPLENDHLYININGFKDKEEWNVIFSKINEMITEWESKRVVYG